MRAGLPLTHTIQFASGFPDADVSWALVDGNGVPVASDDLTPLEGAVSINLNISAVNNELGIGELYGFRELSWEYQVDGVFQTGTYDYQLYAKLPFGVSEAGVRKKLGLETHEVEDDEIDLLGAYLQMQGLVGAAPLEDFGTTYSDQGYMVTNAIEALAALQLIPSLQVRIANKESSGTTQFTRGKIDWAMLERNLLNMVNEAVILIVPEIDLLPDQTTIFIAVPREVDLFPG